MLEYYATNTTRGTCAHLGYVIFTCPAKMVEYVRWDNISNVVYNDDHFKVVIPRIHVGKEGSHGMSLEYTVANPPVSLP